MKDNTVKLLGLEDVIVRNIWDDEESRHIEIELPRRRHNCPCCKAETERIHDYRMQRIKDIAAFGKNVFLHLRKRRAEHHRITDILPNRKKTDLIHYFRHFNNRKDVEYVVMDRNQQFREVAQICFPQATIVIDRYHVTRQAIWAMERVRKEEQKKLSAPWRKFCKHSRVLLSKPPEKLTDDERERLRIILGLSTRLEQAYDLKNQFLQLMHAPSSKIAKKLLADWVYAAEVSHLPEFYECTRAIHNWSSFILNSFDCPYTNGFTEGCNNKTKVLKRVCYGVSNFSRFRNRILHCAS